MTTLDDLRARIDEIDSALHDLLRQRISVVEEIAAFKGDTGGNPARPAREASILRTLVARHEGNLPTVALLRIWREIVAAACAVQGPFTIAVEAPAEGDSCWDTARDHFGASVPLERHSTAAAVVRAVRDGKAAIGVVAFANDADRNPWWRQLAAGKQSVRLTARLPLYGPTNAKDSAVDAAMIAPVPFDPSGDDKSLLAVELDGDTSLGSFAGQVEKAGGRLVVTPMGGGNGPRWCLVELDGHHGPESQTVAGLSREDRHIVAIGGYPVPIAL
ncbi:MAG: chorismate mutase [Alphaproteobacteria bacterium]|nr:chorismate mutase [Alphaproteobacteria bacterium]